MSQPQIPNRGARERFTFKGFLKNLLRIKPNPATTRSPTNAVLGAGAQHTTLGSNDPAIGSLAHNARLETGASSSSLMLVGEAEASNPARGFGRVEQPSKSHGSFVKGAPPLGAESPPRKSRLDKAKDQAEAAGSFIELLLKKAPAAIHTNPVKVAFGIAQIAVELKQGMQANMDATESRIAAILELMIVVNEGIQNWHGGNEAEMRAVKAFEATLSKELNNFVTIQEQSKARQFLVQDDDKQHILDIFERVNEARENMIIATGLRVHQVAVSIDQQFKKLLREQLKPSYIADHKYYLEGETAKAVRRVACTPGTRPTILSGVKTWANNPFSHHSIYWLFGPAGTGKTTIACTIARRFEYACIPEDNIVLGANFFCSRQFVDTRSVTYVVRTIVYQLTLVCKAFADAYHEHGDESRISYGPAAQLQGLLVTPWKASEAGRTANNDPMYLVDIDAVDELDDDGGSELLAALINVQSQLQGLKFFITSREDRALAAHAKHLGDGNVCRLQEIPTKEADNDVRIYLIEKLGHLASDAQIDQLVTDAAGLFIYAATTVGYVVGANRSALEKREQLNKLLDASASHRDCGATRTLDNLYLQILEEALSDPDQDIFQKRLRILHLILCTVERTSPTIVDRLLGGSSSSNDNHVTTLSRAQEAINDGAADDVVGRLHAVLYKQGDQVVWFHKSFPDYMFDQARSTAKFYCDQGSHHRLLVERCFRTMHQQLRFNIANIGDSSILDGDNPALQESVKRNISPTLNYACRSWSQHFTTALIVDHAGIFQTLGDFLQLHVLFWIEVMNLLGQRGRCDGMLREARKSIIRSKKSANLVKQLGDAADFAVYFSGSQAAFSTPHVYLSALATFPHQTDLRTTWRAHFKGIPVFNNAIRGLPLLFIRVKSAVDAVAVSPDGSRIVTGSRDGIVRVWDLSTGEVMKTLEGHHGDVKSVDFSPDGKHIVSGSEDHTVRMWDASSGEELKTLEGHSNLVASVAFSHHGTYIVSGSYDKTVRIWDASSGEEFKSLEGHSSHICSVAFSTDDTRIVSGSHEAVHIWNTSNGEKLKTLEGHSSYVSSVAFSTDGTRIVSGCGDGAVQVWETSSGQQLKTLSGHTKCVSSVAFSSDDACIVSGSPDSTVRMWKTSNWEELETIEGHTDAVYSVAFLTDGTRIVSGSDDQTVRVWSTSRMHQLKVSERHADRVHSVAFSQDGTRIVSGSHDNTVRIWDASSGLELKTLEGHSNGVQSVGFSSDGTRVVSGSADSTVRVWDSSSGKELKVFTGHHRPVSSVAFSHDGTRIVSGSSDGTVRVWDASSGEELKTLNGHGGKVHSAAFSRDGTRIVSGSDDDIVRVWNTLTGRKLKDLKGHSSSVRSAAFSQDCMRIVSGSGDKTVRVWDVSSGEQLKRLEGHGDWVRSVAFSQDGTCIVSASDDKTVRVWNASSGEEIEVLSGHREWITSAAFSPAGTHVVSGSQDKTVRVWRLSTGKPADRYTRQKTPHDGHNGWLLSPSNPSAHLMFVPPSEHLPDDSNILTIPHHAVSHVDLSQAKLGIDWAHCYTPALKN